MDVLLELIEGSEDNEFALRHKFSFFPYVIQNIHNAG